MKLDVSSLEEAHRLIDKFIRSPQLYKEAVRRSKRKAMDLIVLRRKVKKAIDLLGDDKFFDIVSMLEDGKPLAHDEDCALQRLNNEAMYKELRSDSEFMEQAAIIADAFFDSIERLKQ